MDSQNILLQKILVSITQACYFNILEPGCVLTQSFHLVSFEETLGSHLLKYFP
jgi:hypothetical protein